MTLFGQPREPFSTFVYINYGHLRQLMIRSLAMRRVMWLLHQLPRAAVPYNPFRDIDEFEHGRFVPHTARDR